MPTKYIVLYYHVHVLRNGLWASALGVVSAESYTELYRPQYYFTPA
jgi:hypothetical protein